MSAPNPHIGEADFRGLRLRMDFDSFSALEKATGKKMPRLVTEFEMGLGLTDIVQWFKCLAVEDVSIADIKAVIHQGGMTDDYEAVNNVISDLMKAFFAPEKKAKKGRPQTAE